MTYRYATLATPIGALCLATRDGRLAAIALPDRDGGAAPDAGWERDETVLPEARAQLAEWFAGTRHAFSLELDLDADEDAGGTPFRRRVWAEIDAIPWGETRSYGELAAALGSPGATRAVGTACGANPLPIVRPCHRVLAAGGGVGGFAGGLVQKRWLLGHEGVPGFVELGAPA